MVRVISFSDTVQFFPHSLPFPQCTTDDFLKKAALDIIHLLKQRKDYLPKLQDGDKITTAYAHIADLLNRIDDLPPQQVEQLVPSPQVTPLITRARSCAPIPPPRVDKQAETVSHRINTPAVPRVEKNTGVVASQISKQIVDELKKTLE